MQLEFVTLAGPKLQKDVYEVILPTTDGNIAIFAQHMPLVTAVIPGVITVRHKKGDADGARDVFATNGGVAEMTGRLLRLLVDEADHADTIVEKEAAEALAAAKKLKAEAKNAVELAHAETLIDRHTVRLKVAELRRHGRRQKLD
jgi:F-type H+-transporting ATPase subunit epsilon